MKKKLHFLLSLVVLTLFAGMAKAQEDVTAQYVKNADLTADVTAKDNGWTCSWRQDYQKATDDTHVNVVEFYAGWGALENTEFSISQTLTLPAGDYRLAVNAFYRHGDPGDGTNNGDAYIFAGEKTQNVVALASGALNSYTGSNELWKASNAFFKGEFSNAFDFTLDADGDIEIGFKGTFDLMRSWVIFGPVKLYKYTLADYIKDYNAKVAEAENLYEIPMNADVLAELKKAATIDVESATKSAEITAAIQALTEAIANANNSIAIYKATKATLDEYADKLTSLDENGQAAYDVADIQAAYDDRSMVEDQSSAISAAYAVAVKAQITAGADFTDAIVNPSFETGNVNGWTNTGAQSLGAQSNNSFENKQGNYYAEKWHANGTINCKQTIKDLPSGTYKLSAYVYSEPEGTLLIANEGKTEVTANKSDLYEVEGIVTKTGELVIGVECTLTASTWLCVDDFKLTLVELNTAEEPEDPIEPPTEDKNPVVEAELVHTASASWGSNTGKNTVDSEAEYYNTEAATGWAGVAFAEFNMNVPKNATILNAQLVWMAINGNNNADRENKVYCLNAGQFVDYEDIKTQENAHLYTDAKTFVTNVIGKGTYNEETDVTDVVKAILESGQSNIIFQWTGNAGGATLEGKASENAPKLTIEYVPGAPELVNPAFDVNPEDIVTVTTQGYTRNIPEGSDQVAGLQTVTGWTPVSTQTASDPGFTGGVFAYGSKNLLNNKVAAPATDPEGNEDGVALGLAAIWDGIAQYTQEITLPAGDYILTYAIYNGINTGDVTKNLFGFIAEDGTEHLSTQKSFAVGEWQDVVVTFTLDKQTKGNVSVGFCGAGGSGSAPHLFVDNVSLVKAAGMEVALSDLEKAIAAAKAETGKYNVGEGLFQYSESEMAPLTKAITDAQAAYDAAESKDAIEAAIEALNTAVAAFAPALNAPEADKAYALALTTSEGTFYLNMDNGIRIEEDATPIYFVDQEGGKYALSNGEEYVNYAGTNSWDMAASADPYAWAIAAVEGGYTITGNNSRFLGTNTSDGNGVGSPCYGDKQASNGNYIWTIEEYVEPVKYSIEIAATENGTVTADMAKAKVGKTITLTITPAKGYELDALTVTYGEDKAVEVKEAEEGVYTFAMPEANVTVSATFAELPPVIAGTSYEGVIVENGVHAQAGDLGNKTEEQTVTIADPVDGVTSITFSGINYVGTTVPMPITIPEFTIDNVTVVENADGTTSYSCENVVVAVPMGGMTANYVGALQGLKLSADSTPVIVIVLANAVKLTAAFAATAEEAEAAINVAVGINTVNSDAVKANGKFFEDGKVVIYRNGVKYGVNGAAIK